MQITLNGEPCEAPEGGTIADLVARFYPEEERPQVAVAVGGEIVQRTRWADYRLTEGLDVSFFAMVAGG